MLAVLAAAAVAAAIPQNGVLVPGRSLAGVRLGATRAQVRAAWGGEYGRCQGCRHPTWYFTYGAFQQQGAGVEFRRGRAVALFTLWQPVGWRTPKGVTLGEPATAVVDKYRSLLRVNCGTYHALTLPGRRALTAFYIVDDKLWAFGLMRPQVPACR